MKVFEIDGTEVVPGFEYIVHADPDFRQNRIMCPPGVTTTRELLAYLGLGERSGAVECPGYDELESFDRLN
jgi:hypothetical protein